MDLKYFWASGVRVESENWSNIGQKTESKSKCILAPIFGRFLLDFGRILGSSGAPFWRPKRPQVHQNTELESRSVFDELFTDIGMILAPFWEAKTAQKRATTRTK